MKSLPRILVTAQADVGAWEALRMVDQPEPPRSGTQAIDRALGLLRVFEAADGDLGITALASACDLSISTTHRLVKALTTAGLVTQDPATERYHLGASLVTLGRRAESRLGIDRWTAVSKTSPAARASRRASAPGWGRTS